MIHLNIVFVQSQVATLGKRGGRGRRCREEGEREGGRRERERERGKEKEEMSFGRS